MIKSRATQPPQATEARQRSDRRERAARSWGEARGTGPNPGGAHKGGPTGPTENEKLFGAVAGRSRGGAVAWRYRTPHYASAMVRPLNNRCERAYTVKTGGSA
jgi:hypothetical protein